MLSYSITGLNVGVALVLSTMYSVNLIERSELLHNSLMVSAKDLFPSTCQSLRQLVTPIPRVLHQYRHP